MQLTIQNMKDILLENVILWVSPHCFILNSLENSLQELFVQRHLLFPIKLYSLRFVRESGDNIVVHIYCTADTNRKIIVDEISEVMQATLLWIGTFDRKNGVKFSQLFITGYPHTTTQSHPHISLSAESLQTIRSVFFKNLVLDEEACRVIHDAGLETLSLGAFVSIPNVAALQLAVGGPIVWHLVFEETDPSLTAKTPYTETLATLTEDSKVQMLALSGKPIEFNSVLVPALRANIAIVGLMINESLYIHC
jgi:hypothetical protein